MTKFKDGGLKFLTELERLNGDDLVYSMARERGEVFLMVVAFPSMTKRRWDLSEGESWDTDKMRLMLHIDHEDYDKDQNQLLHELTEKINHYTVYPDEAS